MGTEALLGEYLSKTRNAQQRSEHSEVVKRVEDIFDELQLPWKRDDDCWLIDSDVGEVRAGLDDDEEVLSLWQVLFELAKPPKKCGELFADMLSANAATKGACFALGDGDGVPPFAFVVARISAKSLDAPEVALALTSVFELSSLSQ